MKLLGKCKGAHWQHYQGGHQRKRRKEARPAFQTSTRNSSSFLGAASNPFGGSRPCLIAPCPFPCAATAFRMLHLPAGRALLQVLRKGQARLTSGPLHWLPLLPRSPSPLTSRFSLSDHSSHPSGLFTGLREGSPALGGHIPRPQHPLPLLQTLIRFVITSLFVLVSVRPA